MSHDTPKPDGHGADQRAKRGAEEQSEGGPSDPGVWTEETRRVGSPPSPPSSKRASEPSPAWIGPYRIGSLLGEGGMGRVYLAEQTEPLRRQVALKVVKRGMDTDEVVSRFESERQALAVLDHPSVARIFDAGVTNDGRPYFVMELVRGVPITTYCDRHRLSIQERLEVFKVACAAVQHAHLKGLIHRDLKPSNILVMDADGKAVPKIIDFGIAKATRGDLAAHAAYTRVGEVLGTPQYMSPEQAALSTTDVDARTDVYSMGLVLYELLAGCLPFELDDLLGRVVTGILGDKDPPRPSVRFAEMGEQRRPISDARGLDADRLHRQLAGDLDWIIMKAIEQDRTRRYSTPNELADDLKRYLTSQPVAARPPSRGYVVRRFARRHRVRVGVAAAGAASLVAASFALAVQSRANAVQATYDQFLEYVEQLLATANPLDGPGGRASLTDRASWALGQWVDRGAREPVVEGRLHLEVAHGFMDERQFDSARVHLARARNLYMAELGPTDVNHASILIAEAELERSEGNLDEARSLADSAVARLGGATEGGDQPALASDVYREAAMVYQDLGEFGHAETLLSRVLARQREPRSEGQAWFLLGTVRWRAGDIGGAQHALDRAWSILSDLEGDQARKSEVLNSLGSVYEAQGNLQRAAEVGQEAVRLARDTYAEDEAILGIFLSNQAIVLSRAGRLDEAAALYDEAVGLHRSAYDADDPRLAVTLSNAGAFLAEHAGRIEAGVALTEEALRIVDMNPMPPGDTWMLGGLNVNRAVALREAGRMAEAESHLLEGLRIIERERPQDTVRIQRYTRILGDLRRVGEPDQGPPDL